ncbi:1436_t:CDS:10 [Scutellospora calospora]|uniref:1436_t:CDS:1 n=1 Tax=Scutellospora calospora TaxID=85575 RepID=A0ACA9MDG9_9GLOM|nr:1436_t:CDS:10 [Scutellospora calospora]
MEKLLKWSIENTDPSNVQQQPTTQEKNKLDPEIIDLILGKSDAVQMREAVEAVSDPETTLEDKRIALDNLEMACIFRSFSNKLVEQVDNANGNKRTYTHIENRSVDREPDRSWHPGMNLANGMSEVSLRTQALWVCGTAIQNNLKAQKAFSEKGGLAIVLNILKDTNEDIEVKSKALYTLSGAIKNYPPGLAQFEKDEGYDLLLRLLDTYNDTQLLRKIIFLFNTLLVQDPNTVAMRIKERGLAKKMINILNEYGDQDEDLNDKVLRTLLTELRHSSQSFTEDEINELRKLIPGLRKKYGECVLTPIEWDELEKRIQLWKPDIES